MDVFCPAQCQRGILSQCDCRETQDSAVLLKAGHIFSWSFSHRFPWVGRDALCSLTSDMCGVVFSACSAPGTRPGSCARWGRQQRSSLPFARFCSFLLGRNKDPVLWAGCPERQAGLEKETEALSLTFPKENEKMFSLLWRK